jgi:Rrf2 family protein
VRLEITRKTDLALKAMMVLGTGEALCKGSELAERIDTTASFISQVMSPLVREGWIASVPGRNGGYRLDVDPDDVSVLELIEAVEGPADENRCVLRGTECPAVMNCALHDPWTRARTALLRELASTRLSDIEGTAGTEGS